MKKIISLFVIFITTVILFVNNTTSFFSLSGIKITDVEIVEQNTSFLFSDCCSSNKQNCKDKTHECCISPFNDSLIFSNIHNSNDKKEFLKGKILDFSFLALIQENREWNYIEKLNSPPLREGASNINNFYLTLTGSTKSNC